MVNLRRLQKKKREIKRKKDNRGAGGTDWNFPVSRERWITEEYRPIQAAEMPLSNSIPVETHFRLRPSII